MVHLYICLSAYPLNKNNTLKKYNIIRTDALVVGNDVEKLTMKYFMEIKDHENKIIEQKASPNDSQN